MKRRLSEGDIHGHCSISRRRRLVAGHVEAHAPRTSPPSTSASHPLALTEDALCLLQQSFNSCSADNTQEDITVPPTPRSTQISRRTRRLPRPTRSRTPSPTKNPTPQTYRTRNLHHADVFVEKLPEVPTEIDRIVRNILEINTWDDQPAALEPRFDTIAGWYQEESQRNTQNVSLEGDWKWCLFGLLRKLSDPLTATLKAHMSEKVWNADLKPPGSFPENQRDEESGGGMGTPRLAQTALPSFSPDEAAEGFSRPGPYLPPSTASTAPTTSTEAADPYHISAPKPDITVGLTHDGFSSQHQRCLVDHQASATILSDPHAADMGIRFPFFVAETKGSSANGTLVSAQNQAAISGASMLVILRDLNNQAEWHNSSAPDSGSPILEKSSPLCFSIVTAGPTHELYVHFMHQDAFHMHCVRSCRTTHRRDTRELVRFLVRILEWGRGDFRNSIVEKLNKIP